MHSNMQNTNHHTSQKYMIFTLQLAQFTMEMYTRLLINTMIMAMEMCTIMEFTVTDLTTATDMATTGTHMGMGTTLTTK